MPAAHVMHPTVAIPPATFLAAPGVGGLRRPPCPAVTNDTIVAVSRTRASVGSVRRKYILIRDLRRLRLASQAECCGFESRHPLFFKALPVTGVRRMAISRPRKDGC